MIARLAHTVECLSWEIKLVAVDDAAKRRMLLCEVVRNMVVLWIQASLGVVWIHSFVQLTAHWPAIDPCYSHRTRHTAYAATILEDECPPVEVALVVTH